MRAPSTSGSGCVFGCFGGRIYPSEVITSALRPARIIVRDPPRRISCNGVPVRKYYLMRGFQCVRFCRLSEKCGCFLLRASHTFCRRRTGFSALSTHNALWREAWVLTSSLGSSRAYNSCRDNKKSVSDPLTDWRGSHGTVMSQNHHHVVLGIAISADAGWA